MNKKILIFIYIILVIISMFVFTFSSVSALSSERLTKTLNLNQNKIFSANELDSQETQTISGYIIDQSQPNTNNHRYSTENWYLIQSFKPSMSPLRKIDLLLELKIYGSGTEEIEISIRETLDINEAPIAQTIYSYSSLNSEKKWIECFFDNVTVIPEQTYFIFIKHSGNGDCYWYGNYNNDHYERGFAYGYDIINKQWQNLSGLSFFPDFDFCFKTYSQGNNNPPNIIDIDGPMNGKANRDQDFIISCEDSEKEDIFLFVDWGDDTNTGWIGPYDYDSEIVVNHTWTSKGSYLITATAKDESGNIGDEASLEVSMPKNQKHFLYRQLNRYYNQFLKYVKIPVYI